MGGGGMREVGGGRWVVNTSWDSSMFQVHRLWQRAFRLHGKGQWVSETPSHLRAKSGAVSLSAIMTVPSASWRRSGGRPSAIGQEGGPCRSGDGDLQLPRMGLLGSHAAMTRGKTSCSTACWPVMLPGPFEGRGGRLSLLVAGCDEGRGAECLELESSFGDCTTALWHDSALAQLRHCLVDLNSWASCGT